MIAQVYGRSQQPQLLTTNGTTTACPAYEKVIMPGCGAGTVIFAGRSFLRMILLSKPRGMPKPPSMILSWSECAVHAVRSQRTTAQLVGQA